MDYQPLFDYLSTHFDIIPTNDEMAELLNICRQVDKQNENIVFLTEKEVAGVKRFTT